MTRRVIGVQFNPWDQVYHFDPGSADLRIGDYVVVRTESGVEMGKVMQFNEVEDATLDSTLKPIVRKATREDIKKQKSLSTKRDEVLVKARGLALKHHLNMKLVDCYFSYDGGKVILVFTADGRVDFRELVKDLARQLQKSIRLQQIGIRDEARRLGGFGACGREVCCKMFLHNLTSVTTDLARIQQVHSRGSERISGVCGRLKCCLGYEADFYQEQSKKFPQQGAKVKIKQGEGTVASFNIIKETVTIAIDKGFIEVALKEVKVL